MGVSHIDADQEQLVIKYAQKLNIILLGKIGLRVRKYDFQ